MPKYLEKELINQIKFHCKDLIDFNSKIEVRRLKVYKQKRKNNLLKLKNYFLFIVDNDWLIYKENSLVVFLISDLVLKKNYIAIIEIEFFPNGLKEEKLISFYETNKFWKRFLISKYNLTKTNS